MKQIPFNIPYVSGKEEMQLATAIHNRAFSGDGQFTHYCTNYLEQLTKTKKALLTPSCTHGLEMAALLCGIQADDEVIMSSFTFVSSANAFVLRGAKIRFVDIDAQTMNIDATKIADAISPKTKAILVMHYAGVACDMEAIMHIADAHQLWVIEDAAQCMAAYHSGQHLGTIGHLGTISFHATKNIHCGEGGALLVNDVELVHRAEIIREKGTNRQSFQRGEVDKYSWVDIGSSYLLGELPAAFLAAQLEDLAFITQKRLSIWTQYYQQLEKLEKRKYINLPKIPANCQHNAHLFFIKLKDKTTRTALVVHLKEQQIAAYFHYVPLHSAPAGLGYGQFIGEDIYTTTESERLLRLPLYVDLELEQVARITDAIYQFFET